MKFLFLFVLFILIPDGMVVVITLCPFHLLPQNFVGLSVADGYIACGSETNEVGH